MAQKMAITFPLPIFKGFIVSLLSSTGSCRLQLIITELWLIIQKCVIMTWRIIISVYIAGVALHIFTAYCRTSFTKYFHMYNDNTCTTMKQYMATTDSCFERDRLPPAGTRQYPTDCRCICMLSIGRAQPGPWSFQWITSLLPVLFFVYTIIFG